MRRPRINERNVCEWAISTLVVVLVFTPCASREGIRSMTGGDTVYHEADLERRWWHSLDGPETAFLGDVAAANGVYYAGVDGGGVYRSIDSGATWQWVGNQIDDPGVESVDATGDTGFALTSRNIYRSLDRGESWVKLVPPQMWDPADRFAGIWIVDSTVYVSSHRFGFWRSDDWGETWVEDLNKIMQPGTVGDSSFVRVSGMTAGGGWTFAATTYGVVRSRDRFATWEWVRQGLEKDRGASKPAHNYVTTFSIASVGSVLVVAAGEDGFYLSTDLGASWQKANTGVWHGRYDLFTGEVKDTTKYAGWHVCAGSSGVVYAHSTPFTYVSDDSGHTWAELPTIGDSVHHHFADDMSGDGEVVLLASRIGVCLVTRAGVSLLSRSGLHASTVWDMDWCGTLHAATFGSEFHVWKERSWQRSHVDKRRYRARSVDATGTAVALGFWGRVVLSLDDGCTWHDLTTGLSERYLSSGTVLIHDSLLFTNMWDSVFVTPLGPTPAWRECGFQGPVGVHSENYVMTSNGMRVFVAAYGGPEDRLCGIRMSEDGRVWRQALMEEHSCPTAMATADSTVYVWMHNIGPCVSFDNGETWRAPQMPDSQMIPHIRAMAATSDLVFAAGWGVYYSSDSGWTWRKLNSEGIYNQDIRSLVVGDTMLYAGTNGSGAYALNINDLRRYLGLPAMKAWRSSAGTARSCGNIRVQAVGHGRVRIVIGVNDPGARVTIRDVSGRLMECWERSRQTEVVAGTFAPGVYIATLNRNGYMRTRRFIVSP